MENLKILMIKNIVNYEWLDYCWERGDNNAKNFKTYTEWLLSLEDSNFLEAYDRNMDSQKDLD